MKRFCHSYWIKPALNERYQIKSVKHFISNLYCAALSVSYIHRLGYKIDLYADKDSIKLLEDIPYDNIIELEIPEDASTRFWAQSKFYALKLMNLGDIHIDGDVMIKSNGIPASIKYLDRYEYQLDNYLDRLGSADIVIQSIETEGIISTVTYDEVRLALSKLDWNDSLFNPNEVTNVANTGVIQFNNQELKDIYIDTYFRSMNNILRNSSESKEVHYDVLVEQQSLYQIADKLGYTLTPLFDGSLSPYFRVNKQLYEHYIAMKKYTMLNIIKSQLENLDIELYKKLNNKINEIYKSI